MVIPPTLVRAVDYRARSRIVAGALATALAMATLVAVPVASASADTAPIATGEPAGVSTDALPTVQIGGDTDGDGINDEGIVRSQVVIGNTVYVGGNFTEARPAGAPLGTSTVTRTNLLAFDIRTGVLINSFKPTMAKEVDVKALAASPDGRRLYVGGTFTRINGVTRNRIAAFDVATGQLVSSFAPSVNSSVAALVATNDTVWIGGAFRSAGGLKRLGVAALSATNGSVLPWAPDLAGNATALVLSPAADKVVIGGNFTTMNGSSNPGYGLGMVSSTGTAKTNLPFNANSLIRNGGVNASITSLSGNASGVYGTGYVYGTGGNFEGAFRASWDDGTLVWVEDCHGDTYSVFPSEGLSYTAGHNHHCGNVGGFPETNPRSFYRGVAFTEAATGKVKRNSTGNYYNFEGNPAPTQVNWYPTFNTGEASGATQGPWTVTGNSQYIVYGGEFTKVNNIGQQGLVRFAVKSIAPNDDGPRLVGSTFVPTATSRTPGSITVSWSANYDRDNELLTYRVLRNGVQVREFTAASRAWYKPVLTYVDSGLTPGQSYTYSLKAIDPNGNIVGSDPVTATAGAGTPATGYSGAVLADNPRHYWRMGETAGTTASDNAAGTPFTLGTGVTRNTPGAIVGDPNAATRFNGATTAFGSTTGSEIAPQVFTVEAWFKSSSTSGGKIVGFGNKSSSASTEVDRHLYLDSLGRVNFGVYTTSNRIIQSAAGFNDNQWHHAVGTVSSAGTRLYVDGALVATEAATTSARHPATGYWRVGGDTSWSLNGYLKGDVDEVAVYLSALSPSQVANHFAIGKGLGPVNQPPTASFTTSSSDLTASFDGSASTDPDGSVASWAWDYGDGGTGSGATSSHPYAQAGTYTATLTVTDNAGDRASTTRSVVVTDPPDDGTIAADSFARSVTNGWGAATTGGAWTVAGGASNFSVGNGVGTMVAPVAGANLVSKLNSVASTSTDTTVRFAMQQEVAGASAYVTTYGRVVGSDDYRARVVVAPGGSTVLQLQRSGTTLAAQTISGLTYATGDTLRVRLQVTGTSPTTIRAKVWREGQTEPSGWALTTTDSTAALQTAGSVGLGFYIGGPSTGAPRTIVFDEYRVTSVL